MRSDRAHASFQRTSFFVEMFSALLFCLAVPAAAGQTRVLKLVPKQLNFGRQPVNSASAPQTVAATNTGSVAIDLYQIISSGVDFKQTNDCPASLAAAASCTITVMFRPAIEGPREGAVILFASDGSAPHTIVVTGAGE